MDNWIYLSYYGVRQYGLSIYDLTPKGKVSITNIYCGNEAEKFDRDCTYNMTRVILNGTEMLLHTVIFLSCTPQPGTVTPS